MTEINRLQNRITDLEIRLDDHLTRRNLVHEIQTIPCVSQANDSTDMVQTHTAANVGKVYVVPFKFTGRIFLRKLSLICASASGDPSSIGLALYALDNPQRVDQDSPRSKALPILRRVEKSSWLGVSSTTHARLNVLFPPRTVLDSTTSIYFAGWTSSADVGRIFCPNSAPGALDATKTFLPAFSTNQTASVSDGFPDSLTVSGDTDKRQAPCVTGRSLVGIRVYGSFTDDV